MLLVAAGNGGHTQGEKVLAKITFKPVKRGRRVYRYGMMHIPARIAEQAGINDSVEAEVWVEERNGERLIVIRPLVKR